MLTPADFDARAAKIKAQATADLQVRGLYRAALDSQLDAYAQATARAEIYEQEARRHPADSREADRLAARANTHRKTASMIANRIGLTGAAGRQEGAPPSLLRALAVEGIKEADHAGLAAYRANHPDLSLPARAAALEAERQAN